MSLIVCFNMCCVAQEHPVPGYTKLVTPAASRCGPSLVVGVMLITISLALIVTDGVRGGGGGGGCLRCPDSGSYPALNALRSRLAPAMPGGAVTLPAIS